jgi:iron complex transport system substrate-binding protein
MLAGCDPVVGSAASGLAAPSGPGPEVPRDYVAHPEVVEEERGKGPARIVSAAPSATELCAALGLTDRLVGRTQYCSYPPAVQDVPIMGAYTDTNLEAIVAAKPDCVLITASSPRLREQFEALDLPLVVLPDSSFEDIFAAARVLGKVTGRSRTAERLIEHLEADLERLGRAPTSRSVLIVTGPLTNPPSDPFIAGPGSFLDELVRRAGHRNAAEGVLRRPWGQVSLETVLVLDPDTLLEAREGAWIQPPEELYDGWEALGGMRAIREERIRSVPIWALNPGPRVNLILHAIVEALGS